MYVNLYSFFLKIDFFNILMSNYLFILFLYVMDSKPIFTNCHTETHIIDNKNQIQMFDRKRKQNSIININHSMNNIEPTENDIYQIENNVIAFLSEKINKIKRKKTSQDQYEPFEKNECNLAPNESSNENYTPIIAHKNQKINSTSYEQYDATSNSFSQISNKKLAFFKIIIQKKNKSSKKFSMVLDITDILTMPQKKVATFFDMCVSTFCNFFKKQTGKKWPFRQIQCIDNKIKRLKKKSIIKHKEDISFLENERKKYLQPTYFTISSNSSIGKKILNAHNMSNISYEFC